MSEIPLEKMSGAVWMSKKQMRGGVGGRAPDSAHLSVS